MKHNTQKGFAVPIVIAIVVIVAVLGGALYIFTNQPEVKENNIEQEKEVVMEKQEEGTMVRGGSYEAYSPEKLSLAVSQDVVLFFRAPWCPTCRALDADIRANINNIPAGVVILDVNYDDSTALKQKYGVTYQHTLVQVDAQGNQIAKWSSSPTLASLLINIK